MPSQHDTAFKRLFAYPELVRALLELVPGCPAATACGFDRMNCGFVSSSARQRIADMVWRTYCGGDLFYLLLEFQSTIDVRMEQRIRDYSGLLSQELHVQHKLREPLNLLPVVVYSGRRKWHVTDRRGLEWLKPLREEQVFILVDEELAGRSIIGDVIRLERADTFANVVRSLRALKNWSMASDGLLHEAAEIASERAALLGANREEIMSSGKQKVVTREFTEEERDQLAD